LSCLLGYCVSPVAMYFNAFNAHPGSYPGFSAFPGYSPYSVAPTNYFPSFQPQYQFQQPEQKRFKVIYFDSKGRAEAARVVLHLAGIDFEDKRITGEELKPLKEKLPFGQVPVLEFPDGTYLAQSHAILRFVGTLAGLYPAHDAWSAAKVDEAVYLVEDTRMSLGRSFYEQDAERKAALVATFVETNMPKFLNMLDTLIKKNGSGYVAGHSLTIADVEVAGIVDWLTSGFWPQITRDLVFDGRPALKEHFGKFNEIPRVKEWNAKNEEADKKKKEEKERKEKEKEKDEKK